MKNKSSNYNPKHIEIIPTEQNLTSQAGLIPVIKYLQKINLVPNAEKVVNHQRGSNAKYQLTDMIIMVMTGMIAGASSMDKVTVVWSDGVLRKVTGWLQIPVATTIQRVFKELSESQISSLETLNHQLRGQHWKRLLRAGISTASIQPVQWIDVDSTVDNVCGIQEGSAKGFNHKKKGARSYHPQIAFLASSKEILQAWFRTGNAYTSNGVVEFTKQLLAHLPKRMKIIFRADSGYFVGALLGLLEKLGHGYLIKVKLKNLVSLLLEQTWQPIEKQPDWESCAFKHSCGSWSKSRQFVAVRRPKPIKEEQIQQDLLSQTVEYDYFCYVTTETLTPWETHKKYGERATCETWIEESKTQMGMGKIRTSEFLANAALFHCAVLAYNTLRWMAQLSQNKTLRQWEPETVRVFLIRVAGKLLTGNRQLRLKTPANHLHPDVWDDWIKVGLLA